MKCDEGKTSTQDNTPYDDVGKTLLYECPALIIPIINEIFGEDYALTDHVELLNEVHAFQSGEEELNKRYKDGYIRIIGKKIGCYHIELQSVIDHTMVFRMFEYDIGDALNKKQMEGNRLVITIVRSAVIYLRHDKKIPETYVIEIRTPGGDVTYEVPILKSQVYKLEEIFEKKLLFLLPFYLFCYEKDFSKIEKDEEKLWKMKEEYKRIKEKLNYLHENREITLYEKQTIISMIHKVAKNLTSRYKKIQEGVDEFMGGKVLMYEAKEIRDSGIREGIALERKNTERERQRADEAEKQVDEAKMRADEAEKRVNEEKLRADEAVLEIARLRAFIAQNGMVPAF